ncbi:MAG: glycosyltransferase family 39 protein [Verrucomicrobia bacterium]|nr:glycosyltransferase family 39 protein [Verrucomicrobiota bacterium]
MSTEKNTLTRLTRAFVWVSVPVLLFVQLFVTFRGLSSPLGMEQAQVARELARGHGFHTLSVHPYAWRQLIEHGKPASPLEMQDIFNPPLQTLVLLPVFRAFESFWPFNESADSKENTKSVYFMDRVVAAVGLIFFMASAGVAWITARRLFDVTIAGWMFVTLLACQFLWDVARSGLPQMMTLFFFSIALHQFLLALQRRIDGGSTTRHALIMGLMGALIVFSHWMGLCLVLGLSCVAAWHLRPRTLSALLVLGPALLALAAWGARNHALCGDIFGDVKATLQATLAYASDSMLLRDFSGNSQPAAVEFVVRKVLMNFTLQVQNLFLHLGAVLPAALFFIALLHPFRRAEVRTFGWSLAVIWLFATAGMSLTGLPLKEKDVNQIHSLFIPAMTIFGFAFLAVLWGRLGINHARASWWSRHGLAAAAFTISALPLINILPTELTMGLGPYKGEFAHWPPYMPKQIHKVAGYTESTELIFTDMPWAVAWYADRPAVWLPTDRKQFDEMRALAEKQNISVAGFLMTPESLRADRAVEVFSGEYREWARLAFRGIIAGFGTDIMTQTDFPYREFIPLAGQPGNEFNRYVYEMAFMSDRKRWEKAPVSPTEKKLADDAEARQPSSAKP